MRKSPNIEQQTIKKQRIMKYYLASIKRTSKKDKFITFWCDNDCGYTYIFELFGDYSAIEPGYHDSEDTKPIPVEVVMNIKTFNSTEHCFVVLNTEANRKILGITLNKETE